MTFVEISDMEIVTYGTWKYVMFISKLTYGTIGLFRDIQKYSKTFRRSYKVVLGSFIQSQVLFNLDQKF